MSFEVENITNVIKTILREKGDLYLEVVSERYDNGVHVSKISIMEANNDINETVSKNDKIKLIKDKNTMITLNEFNDISGSYLDKFELLIEKNYIKDIKSDNNIRFTLIGNSNIEDVNRDDSMHFDGAIYIGSEDNDMFDLIVNHDWQKIVEDEVKNKLINFKNFINKTKIHINNETLKSDFMNVAREFFT